MLYQGISITGRRRRKPGALLLGHSADSNQPSPSDDCAVDSSFSETEPSLSLPPPSPDGMLGGRGVGTGLSSSVSPWDEEEGGGGVECKPVCIRIPLSRNQKYCYACTKCMEPYLQWRQKSIEEMGLNLGNMIILFCLKWTGLAGFCVLTLGVILGFRS